jgi:hypothetical protein
MGTTKRSFYTRKEVFDFLNKTEQQAKINAKKAIEDYAKATEISL